MRVKPSDLVLQLSFILWHLLNFVTLGILSIFFLQPYINLTYLELFYYLRIYPVEVQEENEKDGFEDFTYNKDI